MKKEELALLHRINEVGRVEEVQLVRAPVEEADGYYLMKHINMRPFWLRPKSKGSSIEKVPAKIVPTGFVFEGQPSLEYIDDIINAWNDRFAPNLQKPR